MTAKQSRRGFIQKGFIAGLGLSVVDPLSARIFAHVSPMRLGLVTYLWGKDWDLPTLFKKANGIFFRIDLIV